MRLPVTACLVMAGLRLYAGPLHWALPEWPASHWNFRWYGPDHFGTERARIEAGLSKLPGKQLAIVRCASRHNSFDEWVSNNADIDGSKVVWARDMDDSGNLEILEHYKDRKAWLVMPDGNAATVSPYPTMAHLPMACIE
jgi:hypothetical protein